MFWVRMISAPASIYNFMGTSTNYKINIVSSLVVQNRLYCNVVGATSSTSLTVGNFYHIAATGIVSGANTTTKIYVNGVLEGTATVSAASPAAGTMTIGNSTGEADSLGVNADMGDVRIYNRVLTDGEIRSIYHARGSDGMNGGLVLRLPLKEAAPSAVPVGVGFVKDVSPNKNNYSPTGSPVYSRSVFRYRRKV